MKSKKIITVITLLVFIIAQAFYINLIHPGNIANIYQNLEIRINSKKECRSTVIVLDNAPIFRYAQKITWTKNKNKIINEWKPLINKCDDIVFIKNNPEKANDSAELDFWIGENQVCLKGHLRDKQCIPKDSILFFISLGKTTVDDEVIGEINEKPIYIYFPSWT